MVRDPLGAQVATVAASKMNPPETRVALGGVVRSPEDDGISGVKQKGTFEITASARKKVRDSDWDAKTVPMIKTFLREVNKAVAASSPNPVEFSIASGEFNAARLHTIWLKRMKGAKVRIPTKSAKPPAPNKLRAPCITIKALTPTSPRDPVVVYEADDATTYAAEPAEEPSGLTTSERENLKHCALIIVDVQNDFISGTLPVGSDAAGVVAPINAMRKAVPFGLV